MLKLEIIMRHAHLLAISTAISWGKLNRSVTECVRIFTRFLNILYTPHFLQQSKRKKRKSLSMDDLCSKGTNESSSLSSVTYLLAGNLELNCGHGSLIRNKKTCIKNVMQYFLHMFDRYRHAIKREIRKNNS